MATAYVSTPSFKSHPAFNIWAGLDKNGKQPSEPDRIHRLEINIHTALAKGAKNLSIEKLKRRFSKRQFNFLFMCQWIDDARSIFKTKRHGRLSHWRRSGGKLRLIKTASFEGYSIDQQVNAIKDHLNQYKPTAFVMDTTGPGFALWHPMKHFGETAPWPILMESLQYTHELKAKIV